MANQWYERDPQRFALEYNDFIQRMQKCNPQYVQVKDGRRGFTVDFVLPDCDGAIIDDSGVKKKTYRTLLLWNADHPQSADALYGGSVTCYMLSPNIEEMKSAYVRHGRSYVPHLLRSKDPVTGRDTNSLCTANPSVINSSKFTIVQAAAQAYNWLALYCAGKNSRKAYDEFCKH